MTGLILFFKLADINLSTVAVNAHFPAEIIINMEVSNGFDPIHFLTGLNSKRKFNIFKIRQKIKR
ncbi:hypothetical protein SAMN00777080_3034 [Aquiflexum balticum DSM 16537]|uniref:Uncharacterized protein n=1 Tax=Aquiflexum balticum DSM 16537 TaxID=758820 RepID=A0A1W2H680_9BACT|nr:hypothetical protein SAMN00777080_3034 [Aquiflexum balticum DSM 16537]